MIFNTKMKQIYFLIVVLASSVLVGCSTGGAGNGEVVGVRQRAFRATAPLNMVYIKGGTFLMGQTDQDVTFAQTSQTKQVTVPPYFMDETELIKHQIQAICIWVRDSIAITNYLNDQKYYLQPKKGAAAILTVKNISTGPT
jgi:sulfatase modifying factor 1